MKIKRSTSYSSRLPLTLVSLYTGLLLISNVSHAVTITWGDNLFPSNPFPAANVINNAQFNGVYDSQGTAPNEFRIAGAAGSVIGGETSVVDGTSPVPLSWEFDDVTGELLNVSGSDITPGGSGTPPAPSLGVSDVGLFLNAKILGQDFGFLAPTLGSAAGNFFGVASISRTDLTNNGMFTIHFPVLELQWAGSIDVPGTVNGGIDFDCNTTNYYIRCTSEYLGQAAEGSSGLIIGNYLQWELAGSTPSTLPVPAAVWLFGSGLLGLIGLARRKVV